MTSFNTTDMTRSRRLWWQFCCWWLSVWFKLCYRHQALGVHHIPSQGPVLLVANHQSFFDPIIIGIGTIRRPYFSLARASLFRFPVFGWLLRSFHVIPVERGAADMTAMRRCLDVLQQQRLLLLFPEGTRSDTGMTLPFAPGMLLLIKRAKPTVIPVAVEGGFHVWPKTRKYPRLFGKLAVSFGQPIAANVLLEMSNEQALEHLQNTVEQLRLSLTFQLSSAPSTPKT